MGFKYIGRATRNAVLRHHTKIRKWLEADDGIAGVKHVNGGSENFLDGNYGHTWTDAGLPLGGLGLASSVRDKEHFVEVLPHGVKTSSLRVFGLAGSPVALGDGTMGSWSSAQNRYETAMSTIAAELGANGLPTTWQIDDGSQGIPAELVEANKPIANASNVPYVGAEVAAAVKAAATVVLSEMGSLKMTVEPGEPSRRENGRSEVRVWKSAKVEEIGKLEVPFVVNLFVELDTETRRARIFGSLKDARDPTITAAVQAQRAHNDALKKAIATKADGGDPVWPAKVRPSATTTSDLPGDVRDDLDEWWKNVSEVQRRAEAAKGPAEDEAYANYVAGGGKATKPAWAADRPARVETAKGDADSTDWLDKVGRGLGWTGDKAIDALKWAGNGTFDLLKSWGPLGTAGVYAGVKATNAATGDNGKLILYGIIGVAAIAALS